MKLFRPTVLLLSFVLLLAASLSVNAQIYVGTCGGYIFYMNSSRAPGSSVTITVAGCSGSGCSGAYTSQSNGYYVVANLNLPAGGTVNGVATNGLYSGTNSTTANAEYAAFMNITLCRPPSTPVLVDQPDTQYVNVSLQWTNGTDFDGYPTYTQFQLDSDPWIITSSPYNTTVALGLHTWRVRTCNALCCSPIASDSFNVYCQPPSTPVLTPQPDTHNNSVSFQWINGTDPNGNPTYTQFQLNAGPWIITSSPYNASGLPFATHVWRVRTCNSMCCSGVGTDAFDVYNNPPSVPQLVIIPDSNTSNVTLDWTSGIDPDGDGTYDQYGFRRFDQAYTTLNASPPVPETGLSGSYFWRVRTCDTFDWCSNWNESSFTTLSCGPGPSICPPCGGGGECPKAFNLFVLAPSVVQDGATFAIDVTLENKDPASPMNYLSFEVASPSKEVTVQTVQVTRINSGETVHITLPGATRLASGTDKTFTLTFRARKDNNQTLLYEKQFDMRLVRLAGVQPVPAASPSPCPPCPFAPGCRVVCAAAGATITPEALTGRILFEFPNWLWLLIVLLLLLLAAWLWRLHKKKKKSKPAPGLLAYAKT